MLTIAVKNLVYCGLLNRFNRVRFIAERCLYSTVDMSPQMFQLSP